MTFCRWSILAVMALVVALTAPLARAEGHDRDKRLSVTVAFGAGLNTTGAANHQIVPAEIHVKAGGVVNFAVALVHQIFVYSPGKTADDVVVPDTGTYVDDLDGIYYQGLLPTGSPPPGFSNAQNRVESVSFSDPGTYLVICNIRSHFSNGMFAYVVVEGDENDGGHNLQ